VFIEPQAVAKRIDHFHALGVPRGGFEAGTQVLVAFGDQLGMEFVDASEADENGGAGAGVAVVAREMEEESGAGNLHVKRQIRLEAVLPVTVKAEEIDIELVGLGFVENAADRNR